MGRLIAVMALAMFTASCAGCNLEPGTGEKIGQIVKLSKQGLFCDTWEGQIIRGGMSGGSGTVGVVPFDFTIESEAMAREAEEAMRHQTEVLIRYRAEGIYKLCRSSSSGHFLTAMAPAPPASAEQR